MKKKKRKHGRWQWRSAAFFCGGFHLQFIIPERKIIIFCIKFILPNVLFVLFYWMARECTKSICRWAVEVKRERIKRNMTAKITSSASICFVYAVGCSLCMWNVFTQLIFTSIHISGKTVHISPFLPIPMLHSHCKHQEKEKKTFSFLMTLNGLISSRWNGHKSK